MSQNTTNRRARLSRTATFALTTAATAALTAGIAAPTAGAATYGAYTCKDGNGADATCFGVPAVSSGPLLGLLSPIIEAKLNPFGGSPDTTPGWNLFFHSGAKGVYNAINDLPYGPVGLVGGGSSQEFGCKGIGDGFCRTNWVFGIGLGGLSIAKAVNAFHTSAEGQAVKGFKELAGVGTTPGGPAIYPSPTSQDPGWASGLTQNLTIMFNNVLRPDGGLATRFAPLLNAVGVETAAQWTGSGAGPTSKLATFSNGLWDLTWPYNTLGDFPVTLNPFSLLNSAFAAVPPPNVLKQLGTPGTVMEKLTAVVLDIAGTIDGPSLINLQSSDQCPGYGECAALDWNNIGSQGWPSYFQGSDPAFPFMYSVMGTTNPDLPIMYPTAIGPAVVNSVLKKIKSPYLLGNPLGDILTPAMKILVNIGYDDVITPDKLDTVAESNLNGSFNKLTWAQLGYTAYDRTFYQTTPDKPTPFGWFKNPGLTKEQNKAAYGDAWKAFTGALKEQAAKPLFGILVKNPAKENASTPVAARTAVSAPAASTPALKAARTANPAASPRAAAHKGKSAAGTPKADASRTAK